MYSSVVSHATRQSIHHHWLHWTAKAGRPLVMFRPAKHTVRRYRDDSLLRPHLSRCAVDDNIARRIIAIYMLPVYAFMNFPACHIVVKRYSSKITPYTYRVSRFCANGKCKLQMQKYVCTGMWAYNCFQTLSLWNNRDYWCIFMPPSPIFGWRQRFQVSRPAVVRLLGPTFASCYVSLLSGEISMNHAMQWHSSVITWVGFAEKVFRVKGQMSRSWLYQLTYIWRMNRPTLRLCGVEDLFIIITM